MSKARNTNYGNAPVVEDSNRNKEEKMAKTAIIAFVMGVSIVFLFYVNVIHPIANQPQRKLSDTLKSSVVVKKWVHYSNFLPTTSTYAIELADNQTFYNNTPDYDIWVDDTLTYRVVVYEYLDTRATRAKEEIIQVTRSARHSG